MARVNNVDLPKNKRIIIALTSIFGIGKGLSKQILENAKVDFNTKAGELKEEELIRIREEVAKLTTEGDLRREVSMNIKTKKEINSYEGRMHKRNLPVRGQRTSRNARTRKGRPKTIANKKK